MKQTAFNALVSVETVADALLLANGTNFLFNETTVRSGSHGGGYGQHVGSQTLTALRHRIHYYRRDTSNVNGYVQVFDILESDISSQQTKTATRRGKTRVATRDDDSAIDILSETDWV